MTGERRGSQPSLDEGCFLHKLSDSEDVEDYS